MSALPSKVSGALAVTQSQITSDRAIQSEVLSTSQLVEPESLWTKFRLRLKLRWDFSGLQWDFEIERQF